MNVYIFLCSDNTMGECFERNLFGVGPKHYPKIHDISIDDLCFLYNFEDRRLYGIWKALTPCGCYEKNAWGGKYKYQVKVQRVTFDLMSVPWKNVINVIQDPDELKIYGVRAHNLLQYFASDYASKELSGIELNDCDVDYRKRYPAEYMCEDGHRVRSVSEQLIDNWLFRHGVCHAYEPIVPIPEKLIPDFMVNKPSGECVYIEFWGMIDDPLYKSRMLKKCKIYSNRNFPLIELNKEDLQSLDLILPQKLRQRGIEITK